MENLRVVERTLAKTDPSACAGISVGRQMPNTMRSCVTFDNSKGEHLTAWVEGGTIGKLDPGGKVIFSIIPNTKPIKRID